MSNSKNHKMSKNIRKILKKRAILNTNDFVNYLVKNPKARDIKRFSIVMNDIEKFKYEKALEDRCQQIDSLLDDDDLLDNIFPEENNFEQTEVLYSIDDAGYYGSNNDIKDLKSALHKLHLSPKFFQNCLKYNNQPDFKSIINLDILSEILDIIYEENEEIYPLTNDFQEFKKDVLFTINNFIENHIFGLMFIDLLEMPLMFNNAHLDNSLYIDISDFLQENSYSDYSYYGLQNQDIITDEINKFLIFLALKNNNFNKNFMNNGEFLEYFIFEISEEITSLLGCESFNNSIEKFFLNLTGDKYTETYDVFYDTYLGNMFSFHKFKKHFTKHLLNTSSKSDPMFFVANINPPHGKTEMLDLFEYETDIEDALKRIFHFGGGVVIKSNNKEKIILFDIVEDEIRDISNKEDGNTILTLINQIKEELS